MSPHFTDKETEDIKARDGSRLIAVTKGKQAMNTGHLNSELCHFNLYATPAPCFNICPSKNPILLHIAGNQVSFVSFSTAFLYSNFKTLIFSSFLSPLLFSITSFQISPCTLSLVNLKSSFLRLRRTFFCTSFHLSPLIDLPFSDYTPISSVWLPKIDASITGLPH